jgi:hypothetical protein
VVGAVVSAALMLAILVQDHHPKAVYLTEEADFLSWSGLYFLPGGAGASFREVLEEFFRRALTIV